MADPLYELLQPHLPTTSQPSIPETTKYLSRLLSLRLNDLTSTEPQSLAQSAHSNLVSIQALSARSHRTTTISSDHLSTLRTSLPLISASVDSLRKTIPELDASAVDFASSYGKSKDETAGESRGAALLTARRNASLLARQADKAQDILELPTLLRASIAAANMAGSTSTGATSGANYTQALDLFAHIKRLQILYPESLLIKSVLADAEMAMKDMTTNLIVSLRGQNLRLAAAIRMIGWLRRVAPELSRSTGRMSSVAATLPKPTTSTLSTPQFSSLSAAATTSSQDEGHFGALFLVARLYTFLTMTEALAPLRDLADQETQSRQETSQTNLNPIASSSSAPSRPQPTRKASGGYASHLQGQQTERYLKRYIEIFREQSFATISMYRNVFPADEQPSQDPEIATPSLNLTLPPALQTFPLYLIDIFMATLKQYLPNVTDAAARESLLMQVLYAANSLGRLGADFSLLVAELYEEEGEEEEEARETQDAHVDTSRTEAETAEGEVKDVPEPQHQPEPEWITVIKKHRVQAARLEAMAAGQERMAVQRHVDAAVR